MYIVYFQCRYDHVQCTVIQSCVHSNTIIVIQSCVSLQYMASTFIFFVYLWYSGILTMPLFVPSCCKFQSSTYIFLSPRQLQNTPSVPSIVTLSALLFSVWIYVLITLVLDWQPFFVMSMLIEPTHGTKHGGYYIFVWRRLESRIIWLLSIDWRDIDILCYQ